MGNSAPALWVLKRIRPRIVTILLLTFFHIANAVLLVLFALGSSRVIDSAVQGSKPEFYQACILQAGIIFGILLTLFLSRHLKDKLSAILDRDWKQDILHTLLRSDFSQVSAFHSGELINRMNKDVQTINDSILNTVPSLVSMVTKLAAAITVLLALEPLFSIIVIIAGCIVIVVTAFMRKKLKGLHKRVSEEDGKVSGFLQETLEKLLMVQALDVADEMEYRADRLMERRYQVQRKRKNVSLFSNTCVSIMAFGASFGALLWCSGSLLAGTMSFGTLTAISQLVGQLQTPFVNLSGIIPQYIAMLAAAERLMELEALAKEPGSSIEHPGEVYEAMTAICAQDLCFSYDRDRVFSNASFSIPKGSFGVIVGHSGIGKSTLLKLMLGIFHPESGELYVQTPENRIPLDRSTRRLFAYVPQGNLLLSGTLRDNLMITRPDATEDEVQAAIHLSAMDEFLSALPMGLDTLLGESAAGLSEGQAQRLSIARAVLSQAPILLLDEATSALDIETEALVLQRLHKAGKTCIAVTHRPAALTLSQWQLEIKNGNCTITQTPC